MSKNDFKIPMNQKLKRKKRVIPAGIDVYPWSAFYMNMSRYSIGSYSIPALLSIITVFILFLFLLVPGLPPVIWRYGAFYYLILFPLYFLNVFLPQSMVNEFYGVALFFNICALALETFLTYLIGYNFYQCITGNFPSTCTSNYLIDIIMSVPTLILFFCGVLVCYHYWVVVGRSSGTSRPYAYEYRNI
jgi:hypothetical protein